VSDLGDAWDELEAALPKGWYIDALIRDQEDAEDADSEVWWVATAQLPNDLGVVEEGSSGATPVDALRALADKFRTPRRDS
jgi:hypothetical protein